MGWSSIAAIYSSPEHENYMRDGYEPFSVQLMPVEQSPLIKQQSVALMVFLKKFIPDDGVAKINEGNKQANSTILS
jgi:hypothetical protein